MTHSNLFQKLKSVEQKNEIYEEDIALLQRYFVVMYITTCNATDVNTCRRILFANGASVENTPPTSAALKQHILRAVFQATKWCKCFKKQRTEPDPSTWRWEKVEIKYLPFSSELTEASLACRGLIKCSCKRACRGRCKCFQQELALDNALTNSKGDAIQIRKPEINDCVSLNTNIYFMFCFLLLNKTFMKISECEFDLLLIAWLYRSYFQ